MSTAAAISGTFADFRMVKGRKVCQLVVEVPIEQADAALRALGGVPQPHVDRWVAIARLNETPAGAGQDGEASPSGVPEGSRPAASPSAPKKAWHEMPPSQQAAIRCGEEPFWRFLERMNLTAHLGARVDAAYAAETVRRLCKVKSRADLDQNTGAAERWNRIDTDYLVWSGKMAAPR